jgi:hypothetical protein
MDGRLPTFRKKLIATRVEIQSKRVLLFAVLAFSLCGCRENLDDRGVHYTRVAGAYASDITFFRSRSPYLVTADFGLFSGYTLTIEPGVIVAFDLESRETGVRRNIIMEGRVAAQGTLQLPIVFAPLYDSDNREPGDWGSIVLLGEGQSSTFEHCEFLFPKTAVQAVAHDVILRNCRFQFAGASDTSSGYGILAEDVDSLAIDSCVFENNRVGVRARRSTVWVLNSDFLENTRFGLWIDSSDVTFERNLVLRNTADMIGTGLLLDGTTGFFMLNELSGSLFGLEVRNEAAGLSIHMNNIMSNFGYNLKTTALTGSLDVTDNFWGFGPDSLSFIVERISDTANVNLLPVRDAPVVVRP